MTRNPGETPANQNPQAAPDHAHRLSVVRDRSGPQDQPSEYVDRATLERIAERDAHEERRRARFGLSRDTPHEVVVTYEARERAFEVANWLRKKAMFLGLGPDATSEVIIRADVHEQLQNTVDSVILPTDPDWRDPHESDWLAAYKYGERARAQADVSPPTEIIYCGRYH